MTIGSFASDEHSKDGILLPLLQLKVQNVSLIVTVFQIIRSNKSLLTAATTALWICPAILRRLV